MSSASVPLQYALPCGRVLRQPVTMLRSIPRRLAIAAGPIVVDRRLTLAASMLDGRPLYLPSAFA